MTYEDKIQDYLDGTLSGFELETFEAEVRSNSELRIKLDSYRDASKLSEGLLEIDLQSALNTAKDHYTSDKPEDNKNSNSSRILWISLIAVALVALLFILLSRGAEEENYAGLFAEVYTEPRWPITRDSDDELSYAISRYLEGGELSIARMSIASIPDLEEDIRNYWISELFLKEAQLDSVQKYLPNFSSADIKYERSQQIRLWLEKYNN